MGCKLRMRWTARAASQYAETMRGLLKQPSQFQLAFDSHPLIDAQALRCHRAIELVEVNLAEHRHVYAGQLAGVSDVRTPRQLLSCSRLDFIKITHRFSLLV
jgi:hypothetical protein